MFGTISRLFNAATTTVEAASTVIGTTASAIADTTKRNAPAGLQQAADALNYTLLTLAETNAAMAYTAVQTNDQTCPKMREVLAQRMQQS